MTRRVTLRILWREALVCAVLLLGFLLLLYLPDLTEYIR